ncbi:MAG: c-type cytochrome, partial [Halioglobus sp.]
MKMLLPLVMATLLSVIAPGAMAEEAPAAYAPCATCHGAAGEGNPALNAPALAGQLASYTERQLQHFRSGVRGADSRDTLGMQMNGMAMVLSEADTPAVASWLAGLPLAQLLARSAHAQT